jgi:hypothetical protein
MQCIFIVNNNIQKKRERKEGRLSFTEQKGWRGNKTQTQTKPYLKRKM